jgi:adenylosuccinate lyase
MASSVIPNVLAERYASPAMKAIWSVEGKVRLERELWIAVMKAQQSLGVSIPHDAIAAYERVKDRVDLGSIMRRERTTRHDVKARIDEFCELAGHEHIHKGMTSRDLTENVEQLQVFRALELVRLKFAAALLALANRAEADAGIPLTARTHNVPAQLTTVGKRWAMFGEEMLGSFRTLEHLIDNYPARGLKGAVGTQLDQATLLGGDPERVSRLEGELVRHLGLARAMTSVGQVYPRSLDFRVVACLCDLASGPGNFARSLRLMAGQELASEGFGEGQTGSSAMPHKMNSRSCERINGFHVILKGHLTMAAALAGDQWNEGDVSCSVVRRVVLPDAFFALDGLLETLLTVLAQMEIFPGSIDRENQRHLPFLLSTTFMIEAVSHGIGRESAHHIVKEHATAAARALLTGQTSENDLIARLAADPRLGLTRETLDTALRRGQAATASAVDQVKSTVAALRAAAASYAAAATYRPGEIL